MEGCRCFLLADSDCCVNYFMGGFGDSSANILMKQTNKMKYFKSKLKLASNINTYLLVNAKLIQRNCTLFYFKYSLTPQINITLIYYFTGVQSRFHLSASDHADSH